jgi:hypothetical protein
MYALAQAMTSSWGEPIGLVDAAGEPVKSELSGQAQVDGNRVIREPAPAPDVDHATLTVVARHQRRQPARHIDLVASPRGLVTPP